MLLRVEIMRVEIMRVEIMRVERVDSLGDRMSKRRSVAQTMPVM